MFTIIDAGHHTEDWTFMLPENKVLRAHFDLYQPSPAGWPTLAIHAGRVALGSVNEAAFGVKFLLNPGQFTHADEWEWD